MEKSFSLPFCGTLPSPPITGKKKKSLPHIEIYHRLKFLMGEKRHEHLIDFVSFQ